MLSSAALTEAAELAIELESFNRRFARLPTLTPELAEILGALIERATAWACEASAESEMAGLVRDAAAEIAVETVTANRGLMTGLRIATATLGGYFYLAVLGTNHPLLADVMRSAEPRPVDPRAAAALVDAHIRLAEREDFEGRDGWWRDERD
jgi:hypothetical protein